MLIQNTGANAAFFSLTVGAGTATTSKSYIPAGASISVRPGPNTYINAITASGATTLNVSGGVGILAMAGGGSGGGSGGGGAITATDGAIATIGTTTDLSTANTLVGLLKALNATTTSSIPYGANNIGAVTQGSAASASGAWPVVETVGGAAMSATNGLFVNPATGATFPISGSVSISGTPNVAVTSEVGVGSTGAAVPSTAQYAGMSVGGNLTGLTGSANGLKVDGSAVTQPVSLAALPALATGANTIGAVTQASGPWAINQTQLNGNAISTGTGASGTGTPRVATSTDSPGGASGNPGYQVVSGTDPCFGVLKSSASFSSSTGQFKIITGTASVKTYICHIDYRIGAAAHVSFIEGTGTNCATGTGAAAMDGSTTAANGKPEAANGGEASGDGNGDIMHAATAADDVCILQDSTALIAGRVTYVQK